MIDIQQVPEELMNQTTLLLRNEIKLRGWTAAVPYEGSSHVRITRDDAKELDVFSSTPPSTSYPAAHQADDKYATYYLLKDTEVVPQLEAVRVSSVDFEDIARDFLHKFPQIVVKPIDGAHGQGVTTRVSTMEQLRVAVAHASLQTNVKRGILLQQQYPHNPIHEIRLLYIDNAFIGAIYRQPARVYGDGVHAITKLIELENEKPDRGRPYKSRLACIPVEKAIEFLGSRSSDVPKAGEEVQVLGIANYGAGGETIDATDTIPAWMIEQGVAISQHTHLAVVGIDYMLRGLPTPRSSIQDLDPIVVEVNKSPSLAIHDTPTTGSPRPAVKAYVDYLATL